MCLKYTMCGLGGCDNNYKVSTFSDSSVSPVHLEVVLNLQHFHLKHLCKIKMNSKEKSNHHFKE